MTPKDENKEKARTKTVSFTYTASGKTTKFTVPPLDKTQLISTPELTGIADIVSLNTVPVNASLCGALPKLNTPATFDFRQEFHEYISPIINQGSCGSCWAIASTQSLSSRFAFFRNQKTQPLSAAYLLYCTRDTFSSTKDSGYGCTGGSLVDAFWFFNVNGIVAATCLQYDSLSSWDPTNAVNTDFQQRKINTDMNESGGSDAGVSASGVSASGVSASVKTTVSCPLLTCPGKSSDEQPWVYKTAVSYIVAGTPRQNGANESNIRAEIWANGPVCTGFQVTADFMVYWKGLLENTLHGAERVYQPGVPDDLNNPVEGNHAVQIVGWGDSSEYGSLPYWIIANSWGATNTSVDPHGLGDFGNNGYFLFIRGKNAAAIESNVVAGVPKVHPNVVGALGRSAASQDEHMCNVTRYEINTEALAALDAGKFVSVPDVRNMYEFTLPPLSVEHVAHVKKFTTCPADRPERCMYTGVCTTSPYECGSFQPTQGKVTRNSIINDKLAGARELELKQVFQLGLQAHKRTQTRFEKERSGFFSPHYFASNKTRVLVLVLMSTLSILVGLALILFMAKQTFKNIQSTN